MTEVPGTPLDATPLRQLVDEGVSPWLHGVHRGWTETEWFRSLVSENLVRGAVFDPPALASALNTGPAYLAQLVRLARRDMSAVAAVWAISVQDLRDTCDALLPLHRATDGSDGLVSGALDPSADTDAQSLVAEAVDLTRAVARPNLLVQLPSTAEGLVAARDCLAHGIGVHIADVARVERYGSVLDTYFTGLELARAAGLPLASIASIASVPVGALDAAVDGRLPDTEEGRALRGTAGVSTARLLYAANEERLGCARWRALRAAGARPQRLMWTALNVRDPASPPTRYVDDLVSWGTVQAMSPVLLRLAAQSARPHGETLLGRSAEALTVVERLHRIGVCYDDVARVVEDGSITRSAEGWRELRSALVQGLKAASSPGPDSSPQIFPGSSAPTR